MTRLMKNCLLMLLTCIFFNGSLSALSSLAKNDPYPVYGAIYDPYLTRWQKEWLIGCNEICCNDELFSFEISAFTQKARSGRDFEHNKRLLGDLTGYWNMLGMLYGPIPAGFSLIDTQLGQAKIHVFSDLLQNSLDDPEQQIPVNFQDFIISDTSCYLLTDTGEHVGFFSVPIHYRKIGARARMSLQFISDFGITIEGGFSEIRQTVTGLIDRTQDIVPETSDINQGGNCPPGLCPGQPFDNNFFRNIPSFVCSTTNDTFLGNYTICNNCTPNICASSFDPSITTTSICTNPFIEVENQLMQPSKASLIFRQIGYNDCNFEKTSFEDLRFIFWWRHIYEINKDRCSWPYFFLTPSLEFNFVVPTAHRKDHRELFSLPFGNDGHWSVGFDAGISIDFVETVEIAFYGGMNYFAPRTVCRYHIPTNIYQQGIFPYYTNVRVFPGYNFNWKAVFNAYHFLDRFSAYADWVYVKHEEDHINLLNPDPAFLVDRAECITKFVSQFVDAAIYYDISPNIQIGLLAQFPVAQRNAYRSTTYLGTFRCVF